MVESVEKRQRRMKRMSAELRRYQHALRFFDPYQALRETYTFTATWTAVRRLASVLVRHWVQDVGVAWAIVEYVRQLKDGAKRLKAASDEAVTIWQQEIDALAPTEAISA